MKAHRFGEIARQLGLASESEIETALQRQITLKETWADSRIGEILILMGVLDGLQVDRILSEQRKLRSPHNQSARAFRYYRNYLIVRKLGEGGMGEVFLAREQISERLVVLKMLRKDKAQIKRVAARFDLEARIAGGLNQPNIVTYHNTGFAHGVRFLVMEYVDGETLHDRIERLGRIPEVEALSICREVLKGLAYLHEKGVVHRDLKPSNILLSKDGGIKISDFGSARLLRQPFSESNTIVGTPNYMPPEQVRAEASLDHRADFYALGATLYHALANRPPFEEPGSRAILKAHVDREPDALERIVPELSPQTARIVEKMMAKNPAERFATADEALAAVESALESRKAVRPKREFPCRWPRPRRHPVAAGFMGAMAWLGAALLLGVWLWG